MIIIKVGFIGAGKVGFSLGKYLSINNIYVSGFFSKNDDSAKEASIFTNSKHYKSIKELINDSDAIFITTPDGVISSIWDEVKRLSIQNKLICHCSGSLSSDIFSDIKKYNAYGYSIHPMFAISDKYNSYKNLKEAFITIEGDSEKIEEILELINALGNNYTIIPKENKYLYHAASVMVSNFAVGLINNGVNYLEKCGFSRDDALEALYPLIEFNIKNIKSNGIVKSLTGPVERADIETIKGHYNSIPDEDKELYVLLSKKILEIAKSKNENKDYRELELILGELK